jgi:pimeloyl-ACP methyl ester carboxylesterase
LNKLRAVLMASLVLLASAPALAAPGAETIPDSFAAPATQVVLGDGRAINLRCSGQGERVVLFEAGTNADSSTWYRVLPMLQGQTRACAYDRAGYGFSDEGPMPRDLDADVTDLHELIRAAKLPLPLVLVGHSLGSNIVRRYSQQFPEDVAGMVLVDPPEQGAAQAMSEQGKRDAAALREKRDALLISCEKAAEVGNLIASPARGCLRTPPPWMGERVAASVQANKAKPGYWRTLRSELAENQHVFSTAVPSEEHYGDIPLVVLRAGDSDTGAPEEVRAVLKQARDQTHQRIIAASTRSKLHDVPDALHDIQLDRPEAVASAVTEMLRTTMALPTAESARP